MSSLGRHQKPVERAAIELWAGAECTVNRVGNRWRDQLELTGHAAREDDIDQLVSLGAKAIRFPLLWERTAPDAIASADWSWGDARLSRLRDAGVRPIVGLVHHGSGPSGTSLVDPEFPRKLADYARAVAERYPWIHEFTPVNEPLTTARFCGLYGAWYPHGNDERVFARALVNECLGVLLSMRAIREVTPDAKLVQTEDVGTIFSTPRLAYQAEYENERRWLAFDLLCGRVDHVHPMRRRLIRAGITRAELDVFVESPSPPDVLGINYYVTSDRFLDERLERYPRHTHGGNGRQAYADVEAVRVRAEGIVGHRARLEEAWARYHIPLALTEVHLGCTREEQIRWLDDAWRGALEARGSGADVRALTLWSAFGAVDWDSLLTRELGHYEPGAFDVRAPVPRSTALVAAAKSIARNEKIAHPVVEAPGWWRRRTRLAYPAVSDGGGGGTARIAPSFSVAKPILIAGSDGVLGRAFTRACVKRGLPHHSLTKAEMEAQTRAGRAKVSVHSLKAWAVVDATGFEDMGRAAWDFETCERENVQFATVLAEACEAARIKFVTFSSHLVFDGSKGSPYVESDTPSPRGRFAESKHRAEKLIQLRHQDAIVVRTGPLFDGADEHGFIPRALNGLSACRPLPVANDIFVSPIYTEDLVNCVLDLLIDGSTGLWHFVNDGAVSLSEWVRMAAEAHEVSTRWLVPTAAADLNVEAHYPRFTALRSERTWAMPTLENAIERYASMRGARAREAGAA